MNAKKKTRSAVWSVFTITDRKRLIASCDLCKRTVSCKSTTSNLRRHLRAKHPTVVLYESSVRNGSLDDNEIEDEVAMTDTATSQKIEEVNPLEIESKAEVIQIVTEDARMSAINSLIRECVNSSPPTPSRQPEDSLPRSQKVHKPMKRPISDTHLQLGEAFTISKTEVSSAAAPSKMFGQYVGNKLQTYDKRTSDIVQYYFSTILYHVDMGNTDIEIKPVYHEQNTLITSESQPNITELITCESQTDITEVHTINKEDINIAM